MDINMKNITPFSLFEMSKYSSKEWNEIVFEFCKYTQDNRKELRDKVEQLAINSEFDCERNKYLPDFYIKDEDRYYVTNFDKDNIDKDSDSFNFDESAFCLHIIKESGKWGSRTMHISFANNVLFGGYNDTFILTITRIGRKGANYAKQFDFPLVSLKNPKKLWDKILNIIEKITNEEFNPRFE